MQSVIKYILLNALRDKIYLSIFLALIVVFASSLLLGSATIAEASQNFAIFVAGASRFVIIFGLILFVCLTVTKAFENKEVEFIISKAISRESFVLSYLVAFLATSFFVISLLVLTIFFIAKIDKIGAFFWLISLFLESWIVISFALLCALVLRNSFAAILATMAFYFISRMMGIFVMAIEIPQNLAQAKNAILSSILKFLSVAFPRLDLFSQSSWLIYGVKDFSLFKIIFLQSLIYIPLMIFMSFHDLKRKQF